MNPALFAIFTGIGSLIWNILLVNLGAKAGASWETVVSKVGTVTTTIGGVILLALAGAAILFVKSRIRSTRLDTDENPEA